jgi:hypothetical protein
MAEDKHARGAWRATLDIVNALSALGMFLVALITLWIASDTVDIKNAVGQISRLAQETHRQANAAQTQLEQLRLAQRASMQINDFAIGIGDPQTPDKLVVAFRVSWHNAGQTPTRKMMIGIASNCETPSALPDDPTVDWKSFLHDQTKQVAYSFGPQETTQLGGCYTHSSDLIASGKQGNDYVYTMGYAKYRDIYGKPHLTEYCDETHVSTYVGQAVGLNYYQHFACTAHNCTDEDCGAEFEQVKSEIPK